MESHAAAEIEGLPAGFGRGLAGRAAFGIAIAFSVFQLWTAAYGTLPSQVVRAMHVGFLLLLGFALLGNLRARSAAGQAWFWLLGLLGFGTGVYNWVFYTDLIRRHLGREPRRGDGLPLSDVRACERRLGLSDIASSLGLAKGTAHGILRTLQQEGFVEQDDASGRYQLGAELLRLGTTYLDVH